MKVELYTINGYDLSDYILPNGNSFNREWFERDPKTTNHAKFCLPLLMANGIGYTILSPSSFILEWDGDKDSDSNFEVLDAAPHGVVTNHSTRGGFTIQSQMVVRTPENVFTYIKGIPNRRSPFTVMEALIESWWNPSTFGIVCLCNSKGRFKVSRGQPLAHMIFVPKETVLGTELHLSGNSNQLENHRNLMERRSSYTEKELFYFKGNNPDGSSSKEDSKYKGPHYKPGDLKKNTIVNPSKKERT